MFLDSLGNKRVVTETGAVSIRVDTHGGLFLPASLKTNQDNYMGSELVCWVSVVLMSVYGKTRLLLEGGRYII